MLDAIFRLVLDEGGVIKQCCVGLHLDNVSTRPGTWNWLGTEEATCCFISLVPR